MIDSVKVVKPSANNQNNIMINNKMDPLVTFMQDNKKFNTFVIILKYISTSEDLFIGSTARGFSERKVIEPPVWKLVQCQYPNSVYYSYAQPFYDYSVTGLFSLANMSEKNPVLEKDRDFNPIGTYPNTYFLSGFTEAQAKIEYEKHRCPIAVSYTHLTLPTKA